MYTQPMYSTPYNFQYPPVSSISVPYASWPGFGYSLNEAPRLTLSAFKDSTSIVTNVQSFKAINPQTAPKEVKNEVKKPQKASAVAAQAVTHPPAAPTPVASAPPVLPSKPTPTPPASVQEKELQEKKAAPEPAVGIPRRFDSKCWENHLYLSGKPLAEGDSIAISNALRALHTSFPTALPNPVLMELVKRILAEYDADSTLMGSSICPDEVCHESGGLPNILQEHFGENFHFGGLAGIPFVGKSGFAAFAHHMPENGSIFLVVAPHMGVSRDGEIGMYHRLGQDHASTCCGAALAAYKHIQKGEPIPQTTEEDFYDDHQLYSIMKRVRDHFDEVLSDPRGNMVGLSKVMFEFSYQLMMHSINMQLLHGRTLVLLGGIQVNMPKPLEDFFVPMVFQKLNEVTGNEDLLDQLMV